MAALCATLAVSHSGCNKNPVVPATGSNTGQPPSPKGVPIASALFTRHYVSLGF